MYVAVVNHKNTDQPGWKWTPPPPEFSGAPLLILAVSLPFIAVRMFDRSFSLDLRAVDVKKLDAKYVAAVLKAHGDNVRIVRGEPRIVTAKRVPDERDCPKCGERMVRRRTAGHPTWMLACKTCGYEREMT
jgi:predicted RNA-binding Zn-ribbon protein involved in translation (DUF1610 family)